MTAIIKESENNANERGNVADSVSGQEDVFMCCPSMNKISIGSEVSHIDIETYGEYPCANNLEEIVVSSDNPYYRSEGNCLIENATNTVILGCKNSVIPKGIKEIGHHAFGCVKANEIVIPHGVEIIRFAAFAESEIKRCIVPDSVKIIEDNAFCRCDYIELVDLPQSLEKLEPWWFHRATVGTLIVPAKLGWYSEYGVSYHAYYQIDYGDVYYRQEDGSLTPPSYFDEMKSKAAAIVQDILQASGLPDSFDALKQLMRSKITTLIEHSYPKAMNYLKKDAEFIVTQKAHIYILKTLNESDCPDAFYQKIYL